MRDEIESLRVERTRFDQLYKKLDKELSHLRRQKGQLIEESTQAYDARYMIMGFVTVLKTVFLLPFSIFKTSINFSV